jgi:hypothetical protein
MASRRTKRLAKTFGGRSVPFSKLPLPSQLAILWYLAIDAEAWELPDGWPYGFIDRNDPQVSLEVTREFTRQIPFFMEQHGAERIGYVELPTQVLIEAVSQDPDIAEGWDDFADYHQAYIASRRALPPARREGNWPVILGDEEFETLQDGWGRFHSYVRAGVETIPAIYFLGRRP